MRLTIAICLALAATLPAYANPPGVDPIELKRFKAEPLRGGVAARGGAAVRGDGGANNSVGNSAKMARFSARIMTLDPTSSGIDYATNAQVTAIRDDANRLCVMDIGSATAPTSGFNSYGPAGDSAQPVLIRGNIINICK